ncbi:MAG: RnfH family protein [Gammaproteobacteria bacterium]|nr:RnfH family protein [Gammaproteobacteria bacterium]
MSKIQVEVAYALPDKQFLKPVILPDGACVREAIVESGVLNDFPEIDLPSVRVGIFSKKAVLEQLLNDGDRIEIYRPLTIDPKEARRRRAELPRGS